MRAAASVLDRCRFLAPESKTSVVCTGLVDNPGCVDFASLLDLARIHPNGDLSVDSVDLLAAIGLRGEAEVAIFFDGNGREIAVPVRAMVGNGSLLLKTAGFGPGAALGTSISLFVPGWTDSEVPFHPVSMRAVSFSEFVQCQ